ncbi:Ribonuclease D [Delftia tsuruhatensis]|nr:Ribonuclease D [Delftia tsuruhatensis]
MQAHLTARSPRPLSFPMPRLHAPSKEDSRLLPAFPALPERCIHVPATDAEFAAARAALMAAPVLGFDTESKPLFHAQQTDTGPHLVQLATCGEAWLLQLHHAQARQLAADVLASEAIRKAGFGLDHDRRALPARLGVALHNVIDLDRVFKGHGYASSVGVRAAVALVLGRNFHKSKKISTSNWAAQQLSTAQRHYAANDAHGAAMVHAALPAWERRQPAQPQRPARRPRAAQA